MEFTQGFGETSYDKDRTLLALWADFQVYGNAKRKYCSHKCYVEHRFGKDTDINSYKPR